MSSDCRACRAMLWWWLWCYPGWISDWPLCRKWWHGPTGSGCWAGTEIKPAFDGSKSVHAPKPRFCLQDWFFCGSFSPRDRWTSPWAARWWLASWHKIYRHGYHLSAVLIRVCEAVWDLIHRPECQDRGQRQRPREVQSLHPGNHKMKMSSYKISIFWCRKFVYSN